jgi:hypothetical protein
MLLAPLEVDYQRELLVNNEKFLTGFIQVVSGTYPSFFIGIILTFFNSPSPRLSVLREGSPLRVT